jgi:hypothetical protein
MLVQDWFMPTRPSVRCSLGNQTTVSWLFNPLHLSHDLSCSLIQFIHLCAISLSRYELIGWVLAVAQCSEGCARDHLHIMPS